MTLRKLLAILKLYAKKEWTQKKYIKDTNMEHFAPVVDDDVSRMLQILVMMAKPKRILEIGTSIGFSTVSMAKVIKPYGGKIITIEIDVKNGQTGN